MALATDIMKGGFSAGQAKAIGGQVSSAITAAGTVITDATDLVTSVNVITTAAASTGVQLPSCEICDEVEILNLGANAVKVYPDSGKVRIDFCEPGAVVSYQMLRSEVDRFLGQTYKLRSVQADDPSEPVPLVVDAELNADLAQLLPKEAS